MFLTQTALVWCFTSPARPLNYSNFLPGHASKTRVFPVDKSLFSIKINSMCEDYSFIFDIDGTLCPLKQPGESYADLVPFKEMVDRLRY